MTRLRETILITVLFLAPLAGLPDVAGQGVIAVLEAMAIALVLVVLFRAGREFPGWRDVPGILPLLAMAAYLLLQAVPLPPFLLKLLSATTWSLYSDTIWVANPGAWMPLSLCVERTLAHFFRYLAFGALYLGAFQILARPGRIKRLTVPIVVYIGVWALLAIGAFLQPESGLFTWGPVQSSLFPVHAAGLLAMAFPLVLAQYLANRPHVSHLSLREKAVHFLHQFSSRPHVLFGLVCLFVVAAILISRSWSAIFASLIALLLFSLNLLSRRRGRHKDVWGGLLLLFMVFLAGLALPAEQGYGVRGTDVSILPSAEHRQTVRQNSLQMFRDFPVFGTGAGTFVQAYPRYKSIPGAQSLVSHSSNDLLEIVVETGVVGAALLLWFLLAVLFRGYAAWKQRHSRTSVYLFPGCVCGVIAIMLHGWDSSTLHLFAGGLFVFFICALASAAAQTSSHGGQPEPKALPSKLRTRIVALASVLLALNLLFDVGSLLAEIRYAGALLNPGEQAEAVRRAAGKAALLDPLEAEYRYALADASLASEGPAAAAGRFAGALRLDPLDARYLQRLGLVLGHLGDDDKARRLLRAGVENDPSNPERHKAFAFWLLSRGKKQEALEHVRQAIFWGPGKTREYLDLMALNGLGIDEMRRTLPERSIPLVAFGDYLASIGRDAAAKESYLAAVRLALDEKPPRAQTFMQAAEYFSRRGNDAKALEVILMGLDVFPKDAHMRLFAANLYERLGIVYRAIQEYRGVLAFDPGNEEAQERLEALGADQI